jgi:hypothetical protein
VVEWVEGAANGNGYGERIEDEGAVADKAHLCDMLPALLPVPCQPLRPPRSSIRARMPSSW